MVSGQLRGSRWILTRPRNRAESWSVALSAEGAEIFLAPAIKLVAGESAAIGSSLGSLQDNGLLVFTSATTVQHFFSLLGQDAHEKLKTARWAAVGPATAEAIRDGGYEVTVEGNGTGARELADQIIAAIPCCQAIHYTSDAGLPAIVDILSASGFSIARAEASTTQVESSLDPIRWHEDFPGTWAGIIFSSPASVQAVISRAGEVRDTLLRIPAVVAGLTTAEEVRRQGWEQVEIAKRATAADIVGACANLVGGGTMGMSR